MSSTLGQIINKALEGAQTKKGLKMKLLTTKEMITQHPDILQELGKTGVAAGLRAHPEWREKLGLGGRPLETATQLYAAVGKVQKGKAVARNTQHIEGSWSAEQRDLVRKIIEDPATPKSVTGNVLWKRVFDANPAWGAALRYSATGKEGQRFMAFVGRVKKMKQGKVTSALPAHSNNEALITVAGHEYSAADIEALLKEQRNALRPLKFCPECGYNLAMHQKALTIALRHSQTDT